MKRRFVGELRRYWSQHPKYRDIVDHIQGKYSFRERPSYGIIVKTGSGTRVDLSADNYVGIVNSYVFLTRYKEYPGIALEWIREDSVAIQANGGYFPSPPGIYYIEITASDEFYVDPLLDVYHEQVTVVDSFTVRLQNAPLAGTVRLYEMPAGYMLQEGVNYSLELGPDGKPTGEINLAMALTGGRTLQADYRHPSASTGPHKFLRGRGDNRAIPGCVLAFGQRAATGDRLAVVVQDIRRPAALEYGGKWELTLDFDVVARDPDAQQEIADQTVMYLWAVLRSQLSTEGIEMTDLTLGGESEEVFDETGDDYFYNSAFSLTVQTDWSLHVPLPILLRSVSPVTLAQSRVIAGLTDAQVGDVTTNLQIMETLGLEWVSDPFYAGRDFAFEIIR